MSVFAFISTETDLEKQQKIDDSIKDNFGAESFKLRNGNWLVSDTNLFRPQDVFKKLFGEDSKSSCLIVPFNAYWGVQSKEAWDWLSVRVL